MLLRHRLKAIREAAGITQVELGAAFGRPHTFVHKVEAGDRRIDPVEFCRWCLVCKANPSVEMQTIQRTIRRGSF